MAITTINDAHLSAIADAIREKNSVSSTYTPSQMASAILTIPTSGIDSYMIHLTGDSDYYGYFSKNIYSPTTYDRDHFSGFNELVIQNYGDQITTSQLKAFPRGFTGCDQLTSIPFELNFKTQVHTSSGADEYECPLEFLFYGCKQLSYAPSISFAENSQIGCLGGGIFAYCQNLVTALAPTVPASCTFVNGGYAGVENSRFAYCYRLRSVDPFWLKTYFTGNGFWQQEYSNSLYVSLFNNCYSLSKVEDLGVSVYDNTGDSYWYNCFSYTFNYCQRLSKMTFETNGDGSVKTMPLAGQTIDLSNYVGYASNTSYYNSYMPRVTNDETYQQYKDSSDWWTSLIAYSRYNHDSAVETINSLPDVTAGSALKVNTIKFKGAAGELTDGGAINTLTEEEIAVAATKGWTVTLV